MLGGAGRAGRKEAGAKRGGGGSAPLEGRARPSEGRRGRGRARGTNSLKAPGRRTVVGPQEPSSLSITGGRVKSAIAGGSVVGEKTRSLAHSPLDRGKRARSVPAVLHRGGGPADRGRQVPARGPTDASPLIDAPPDRPHADDSPAAVRPPTPAAQQQESPDDHRHAGRRPDARRPDAQAPHPAPDAGGDAPDPRLALRRRSRPLLVRPPLSLSLSLSISISQRN